MRIHRSILALGLLTCLTARAQSDVKRRTIEPFFSASSGFSIQQYIGTTDVGRFDAVFLCVRAQLPQDRRGMELNEGAQYYYAEAFLRKPSQAYSVSLNGKKLAEGEIVPIGAVNFQRYLTGYDSLPGRGLLEAPRWRVDLQRAPVDYGERPVPTDTFYFPEFHYIMTPDLPVRPVAMKPELQHLFEYRNPGPVTLSALPNPVYPRPERFNKPSGGFFAIGSPRIAGFTVTDHLALPEEGGFQFVLPGGTSVLNGPVDNPPKCFTLFRNYLSRSQLVEVAPGIWERWLFIHASEHVIYTRLQFVPPHP